MTVKAFVPSMHRTTRKSLPLSDAVTFESRLIGKNPIRMCKIFNVECKVYLYIRKNFLMALCVIKSYQCSSSVQNLLSRIYGSSSSVPNLRFCIMVSALELKLKGGRLQSN